MSPFLQVHPRVREIFCGDGLWVLDKPAGVLSHPNPPARSARNAVIDAEYDFEQEAYRVEEPGGGRREVYLIHRLDQETSGLLLLALDAELAAALKEMFYHREVLKEYRALVRGAPRPPAGAWRDHLRKRRAGGKLRVEAAPGRPNAETAYRVIEAFPAAGASLLSLCPETGRTHQLRVQSARRGHPIAGDERYGDFAWNRSLRAAIGLKRMYLHAFRIELRHPRTRQRLKLLAPPGKGLEESLKALRK